MIALPDRFEPLARLERALFIAARETLAMQMYAMGTRPFGHWHTEREPVKDTWRKQAQDMMTEGKG